MESDSEMVTEVNPEEKIIQKNKKHTISLFYVRTAACLIIFGGVIFVKLNNPCLFENFRFWYQNNVCEERFSTEGIKQSVVSLCFTAKEKALNMVSKFC